VPLKEHAVWLLESIVEAVLVRWMVATRALLSLQNAPGRTDMQPENGEWAGTPLVLMATRDSEPQGQTSLECVVEAISPDSALQRCSVVQLDSRYVLSGFPRYARLTEQCSAGFRNQVGDRLLL